MKKMLTVTCEIREVHMMNTKAPFQLVQNNNYKSSPPSNDQ